MKIGNWEAKWWAWLLLPFIFAVIGALPILLLMALWRAAGLEQFW